MFDKDVEDTDDVSAGRKVKKAKKRIKKKVKGLTPKFPQPKIDHVPDTRPMGGSSADPRPARNVPSKPPSDPYDDESPLEKMMKERVKTGEVEEYVDEFGHKRYRTKK
jgi:hypothetical protein